MWEEIKSFISSFTSEKHKKSADAANLCDEIHEQITTVSTTQNHYGFGDNVLGNKVVNVQNKECDIDALLTQPWFQQHIETSIENLGTRYTPQLNFDLDIAIKFDAISRNDAFHKLIEKELHEFLVNVTKARDSLIELMVESNLNQINAAVDDIKAQFLSFHDKKLLPINIDLVVESTNIIKVAFSKCQRQLSDLGEKKDESFNYKSHRLNEVRASLYQFDDFMRGPVIKLSNHPTVLLSGPAGIGKSHLLADIASNRIKANKSCILLLGQHFNSEEAPWTQILRNLLRLVDCNEKQLLESLNATAEVQGERLLFIVDAINEGKGKLFWPDHINGFINDFSNYPWIGLVLSIRSSYEKVLIPDDFVSSNKYIKINHSGFDGVEYQASSFFFSQYNIEKPSIPLLNHEFSNPLFLKLFCEGLNRSGLTRIPKGYTGISSIIDFFIESIDEKLSKATYFDYPSGQKIIRKVIDSIIEYKFEHDLEYIPYEKAFEIADAILIRFSNKRRFLDALISEGILSKNVFFRKNDIHEECVYLAYERFSDHLTATYLLDNHLAKDTLDNAFRDGGKLYQYVNDSHLTQGILESLSIQVPERTGKELYEYLDETLKSHLNVIESFVYSLIWRKPEFIKESTRGYINEYVLSYDQTFDAFFQMVYSISAEPEHYYNADRLHKYLMQFSLADRDDFWTTYLHDKDSPESAMFRLIDWAGLDEDKSYLSSTSRLLAAKALAWLFTSTNILFRDSATKALVALLENEIVTVTDLLSEFENVNDPYVCERIFAAAYGAVLCSDKIEGLERLSKYVVKTIFEAEEEVYPNVLVRDYARNIVEYALYKEVISLKDITIIRPPYRSSFPSSFPSNDEIDAYKYDYNSKEFKDYYWGQNSILSSMVTEYGRGTCRYGDFGRYTFQSALYNWVDFDSNDLSNYACKLIFEKYGYDVEKHGMFDRNASSGDRSSNKTERIGKKYQWIAFYEVLARLSDNHKMVDESTCWKEDKQYVWYQGSWNPFVRNIDPTVIPRKEKILNDEFSCSDYSDWDDTHENWLISEKYLPQPESIISIANSSKNEWLVLEKHLSWEEEPPIGQDMFDYPRKHLWYQIKSYLVKDSEAEDLISWLKEQHLMGRWFPESHDCYQVFSREYYWSPAYQFYNNPYYGGHSWEKIYKRDTHENVIASVLPTAERYIWEAGADHQSQPSYLSPCEHLFTGMDLHYSRNLGEWLNTKGEIILFDSSVKQEGSSGLIVNKSVLQEFLKENNLKIIWTCLGSKNIYGTSFGGQQFSQWLELSGVYTLNDEVVEGELRPILRSTQ